MGLAEMVAETGFEPMTLAYETSDLPFVHPAKTKSPAMICRASDIKKPPNLVLGGSETILVFANLPPFIRFCKTKRFSHFFS